MKEDLNGQINCATVFYAVCCAKSFTLKDVDCEQ